MQVTDNIGGTASMEVCLENVRFHAFHGLLPHERKVGNEFEVNIRVSFQITDSSVADDLSGSLCYAELYALAKEIMNIPANTLEHVAAALGKAILSRWNSLESVETSVSKIAPPIPSFHGKATVKWRWKSS